MRVTMPYSLTDKLVIGISSRALFDLEHENRLFDAQGVEAFSCYQREHEDEPLRPGTAFPLVQALLGLNALLLERRIEVVVISRNSPDTGLRAFNAIEAHGLAIERAAFTGGARSLVGYLKAFDVDLFLSRNPGDVQEAIDHGVAAALLYDPPADFRAPAGQIRIAFDSGLVVGPGKVDLLEHVRDTGSISAAGRRMKMSYKRAWDLIDAMNRHFATPVVETSKGGAGGGGAKLTAMGEEVIERYRRIQSQAAEAVDCPLWFTTRRSPGTGLQMIL